VLLRLRVSRWVLRRCRRRGLQSAVRPGRARRPLIPDWDAGRLPSHVIDINRAWCLAATIACDLLCWLHLLCLGEPLAKAESKTLRYRLLHTAARHHPRPTQTQNPHPRHLALGPTTGQLSTHRSGLLPPTQDRKSPRNPHE
jgi:hypothetical protein